jgi:site-specific recombinase XerD
MARDCLTDEETITLTAAIADDPLHYRLAYFLMLDAGLRVSEATATLWRDLMFGDQVVSALRISTTAAKGGTERTVPLTNRTRHAALACFNARKHTLPTMADEFAISNRHTETKYSTRALQRWLKTRSWAAIGRHVTPHVLRHTFATRLMKVAPDLRTVQIALGHKDLRTTQIYTHPNQQDLSDAVAKLK